MNKLNHIFEKHSDFFKSQKEEIGRLLRSTMKFHYFAGKWYPSVTSIINPTGMSYYAREYGARGTIAHHVIRHYIEIGVWLEWRNCSILEKEIYIIETGRNKLRIEDANYKGFFGAYGKRFYFDRDSLEKRFFNDEYHFTGRPDSEGRYRPGRFEYGFSAIFEYKTIGTYNKKELDAIFMQLAAYAYGINKPDLWGVCIPLNGKTTLGYAEPIVCKDLRPYLDMFLKRRKALKDLYGI